MRLFHIHVSNKNPSRSRGMPDPDLYEFARATMMARMIIRFICLVGVPDAEDRNVLNALIDGPSGLDFCLLTRPLSAPWLNVQTTPSSVLLSEIVVMTFDTYFLNAQQSDTNCEPVLTPSLCQTKTTQTSSLGLFTKKHLLVV